MPFSEKNSARSSAFHLYPALLVLLIVVMLTTSAPAQAQQKESGSVPDPTDEREVEAFLDGYVGHQLEDYHIPGATVSVVKDGEVLFARGYGKANVGNREPVLPGMTLFRIASITKLFSTTAVMQLAEEGELDLHRDVNTCLTEF